MEQITAAAVGFDPDNLSHEINKLINWARSTYTDRDATVNSITPLGKAKGEDLKVLVLFDLIPKPPPAVYATPGDTFTFNDDPDKAFWKPSARIEELEIEVQTQKDYTNSILARLNALEAEAKRNLDTSHSLLARLEALEYNCDDIGSQVHGWQRQIQKLKTERAFIAENVTITTNESGYSVVTAEKESN